MKPMIKMTSRIVLLLGSAAILAVLPMRSTWQGHVPMFGEASASAKGGDNSGSGSSGGGSSGNSGSGSSDSSGSGSSGDSDSGSSHGGSDDGASHDANDDNGNDDGANHDANDDNGAVAGAGGAAGDVVKFEMNGSSIEVVFANGTKEEITNGRYERKNAAGRTVEERAATQADIDRLTALR